MIDKLVIQIPFSDFAVIGAYHKHSGLHHSPWAREGVFSVRPDCLPFKRGAREIYTDDNGLLRALEIYCPWESLESSHGGLAVKPFHEGNGFLPWPYLEIKCSPAKLVQPHNVWGTDRVQPCVNNMLYVLTQHYPDLMVPNTDGVAFLDIKNARVTEIDITYSARVPLEQNRMALIDILRQTSKGQTKNRGDSYQTTAYFGAADSRLRKLKVYLKGPEIHNDIKYRERHNMPLPDPSIVEAAQQLVRFEATIKRNWLERRALPTKLYDFIRFFDDDPALIRAVYNEVFKELFDALSGEIMSVTDDKEVFEALERVHGGTRGRVARLMGFYQGLKSVGFEALKTHYPERTFRRYIRELEMCGFARAHLNALHTTKGNTVIAFPQIVQLGSLGEPTPDDYVYPDLAASA